MPLLNPLNVPLVPLTFTRLASTGVTVDELGNPVMASATVTVQGLVTPLGSNRLSDLAPIVGVEGTGIPVKVRVESWPSGVGSGAAVASLTYNGRPATIRLAPIREASAAAAKVASNLGVSAEGVLVYS
jgi:hypothetical protein